MHKTLKIIIITIFSMSIIVIGFIKILSHFKYSFTIKKADGKIKVPVTAYNFGSISHKDSILYNFKILNIGNTPIILSNIAPSCNCTSIEYSKNVIQPSDTLMIKTKFKPKKEDVGKNKITILLSGNFEKENLKLTLEGEVKN